MAKNIQKDSISSSVEQIFSTIEKALEIVSNKGYLKQAKDEYEKKTSSIRNESLLARPENKSQVTTIEQIYDNAVEGLEKIATGNEESLTNEQKFATEAIILLEGRPPIAIENNKFITQSPGTEWHILENYRNQIEKSILSVGRINLKGNLNYTWVGTGFLVSDDVLMTNAHVAIEFSKKQGERWTFKSGQTASIDYGQDASLLNHNEFQIKEIIGIHNDYDLALLRVSNLSEGNQVPEPLKISQSFNDTNIKNKKVYVIGNPAKDSRRNDPEEMERIFQGIYNVKRLQPGTIIGMAQDDENIIYHDASTLGGNSGSCVIDLETNKVIGLHFGGSYGDKNYAVALWKLVNDPLLQETGVNFQ